MNAKLQELAAKFKDSLQLKDEPVRSAFDLPESHTDVAWPVTVVIESILFDDSVPEDIREEVRHMSGTVSDPELRRNRLLEISERLDQETTIGKSIKVIQPFGRSDGDCLISYSSEVPPSPSGHSLKQILESSVRKSHFQHRGYISRMREFLECPPTTTNDQPTMSPLPIEPFRTGVHGGFNFVISHADMTDADMLVLMKRGENLESLHVPGNKLTDAFALEAFGRMGRNITGIDFSDNSLMTCEVVMGISNLVSSLQCVGLHTLSLSGIRMSGSRLAGLANNLNASGTPLLEKLDLSRTDLGRNDDAGAEALSFAILQLRRLKVLSLDGNYLRIHHLIRIGEALTEMDILEELNLSDNSPSYDSTGALALDSICAMMGSIASLTTLRLRSDCLDEKSAFILADSLCIHPNITELDLGNNARIGKFGTLALLKLVVFNDFPVPKRIRKICLENSCKPGKSHMSEFNFTDPSGHYALELCNPFSRAVARQCLRYWELVKKSTSTHEGDWFRQTFDETFFELRYNGDKYTPEKDIEDVWVIPTSGTLTYTALYHLCSRDHVGNPWKFFACNTNDHGKHPINDLKQVDDNMFECFLQGIYASISSMEQRSILIDCVSTFFSFTAVQIERLIEERLNTKTLRVRIVGNLLPKKTRGVLQVLAKYHSILTVYFSRREKAETNSNFIAEWFAGENPSGPYVMDLRDPSQRLVAEWMTLIDRFEIESLKWACIPTNIPAFTNIRNCKHNSKSFEYYPDWVVPCDGAWSFDYVSPRRFPLTWVDPILPKPHPEDMWTAFVEVFSREFKTSQASPNLIINALRRTTRHRFFIDCNQLSTLLKACETSANFKLEITTILLRRLVDYAELREVLCRPRMGLDPLIDPASTSDLEHRVGVLALTNPMKVDNSNFACDLGTLEGRLIAGMVLRLHAKEKGSRLVNSKIGPDLATATTADPPKSWYSQIPRTGFWSMTYVSSEDGSGQDKTLRRQMALNVCGFDQRTFTNV